MADTPPAFTAPAPAARWDTAANPPVLHLQGDWRGHASLPAPPAGLAQGTQVQLEASALSHYDSPLAAALWALGSRHGLTLDTRALPDGLQQILALAAPAPAPPAPAPAPSWLARVGLQGAASLARSRQTLGFVGEVLQALGKALRGRSALRGSDLLYQLQATGPSSLGIVSLVSFLVGLILAYMGAAQLQRFGAQIYMADLVTIGVVREIAALMTGIILAGRVGAAFAAQLGSMQANEEVDALQSMGLNPMEHLVLPRVLAMTLVAPLLTTYAALVGMLAGLLVAVGIYNVEPLEYLIRCRDSLTLTHVGIGLLKGTVYALLVALAGCRQGLHAGRSAQAVGDATTAAVVQAIVWIVVAASLMTMAFQRLGW
jgi:phospholipid/cholesterol/gamma-HCH transport system permease protein